MARECPREVVEPSDGRVTREQQSDSLEASPLDLLQRLNSLDSHGTVPLGWECQVCSPIGMTGLLAGPSRRYSSPRHGDSELP
ncbi:MAG: hypothetical protein A07HR60_00489 [uncultured archaeon A07HR60]|nr:MAG: hypothetical protein A07HR60_00489 [uncultured archaeon A07HR60]